MPNHTVTIGNTTPEAFAAWLDRWGSTWAVTITGGIGYYDEVREDCVVVTFYGAHEHVMREILAEYGRDHPREECFGLVRAPDSLLVANHSHVPLVAVAGEDDRDVWNTPELHECDCECEGCERLSVERGYR